MKSFTALTLTACALSLSACSSGDSPTDLAGSSPLLNTPGAGADFMGAEEDSNDAEDPLACGVRTPDTSCVGQTYAGEAIPLDIYIMFDQSGSMCTCLDPGAAQTCPNPECGETRIDAVRRATELFLQDPQSAGIGVGLGFFGKQPIGQASCDENDYSSPAVGVGVLPEHASSILGALDQVEPTGETPTGAAIRGACSYAESWKQSVPHHRVVMLLLTDGKPEAPVTCQGGAGACCPALSDAVAAAEACRTESEIETYVLGVGPLLENLEQIAVAGGTERAYLVEGGDVSARVLDALNLIRGAAIPCQLQLPRPPEGETLDYGQVNLEYESASCERTLLYSVQSAEDCGTEDGWYYDDPTSPQGIQLCPASCDRVSAPGGQLNTSVGCATQFRIR